MLLFEWGNSMALTICPPGKLYTIEHRLVETCQTDILLAQLVPCLVLVMMLPLLPESPRWLLMHNKTEEGAEALRRYLGKGLSVHDRIVEDEFRSITAAIQIERQSQISLMEVLCGKDRSGHLKRLLLGCGGQFMQVRAGGPSSG